MATAEEHFVLRVQDVELAKKLRGVLLEKQSIEDSVQLNFSDNNQDGRLTVEGKTYPVKVLNLPTVVEAYKTYDDTNLVKIADVGQLLLVGPPNSTLPAGPEHVDGITPPFRNARGRHFKPVPKVDPAIISQVERDLLSLLEGCAPENMEIIDQEEEYIIDTAAQEGSWQPVK